MRYRISEIKIGPEEYADAEHRKEHIERALQRKLRQKYGRRSSGKTSGKASGKPAARVPAGDTAEVHSTSDGIRAANLEILRESIDARHKPDVKAVYTLDFDCEMELPLPEGGIREYEEEFLRICRDPAEEIPGKIRKEIRPVIAGFGPCGIFAALLLAQAGLRPIVLERGQKIERRMKDVQRFWEEGVLDPESNVQFGEGGAGTFSDGKLTTGIRDIRIRKVLKEFVAAGADPAILYQQRPHIGTDQLQEIIPRIRRRIEELGGEIRFGTKLMGLETAGGKLTAVTVSKSAGSTGPGDAGSSENAGIRIPAQHLILAIGHSARDTFRMLQDMDLPMEQKAFSIGVRIEHPQERIDRAQYGDPALAEVFGPAVYKLHHRCENGRGVYTFCMCPGGRVINAASEEGGAVTNGMSESARDSGTANSGLLVDVRTSDFGSDDPLAGVEFQRRYERLAWEQGRRQRSSGAQGAAPAGAPGLPSTSYGAFRKNEQDPVRKCLPAFAGDAIVEAMPHLGRKLKGFDAEDAVMTAVETRSSSPVRILRDERMHSGIRGVIPAGEGPGYAGGIVSAAVDGIRAAERILLEEEK